MTKLQKPILSIFIFVFYSFGFSQSNTQYTKYSHSEFLKLLQTSSKKAFYLNDAIIYYNLNTDAIFRYKREDSEIELRRKDTIVVEREIVLNNVHFEHRIDEEGVSLGNFVFKEKVKISDCSSLVFRNSVFEKGMELVNRNKLEGIIGFMQKEYQEYNNTVGFMNCLFLETPKFIVETLDVNSFGHFEIYSSEFRSKNPKDIIEVFTSNVESFAMLLNTFHGDGVLNLFSNKTSLSEVSRNDFGNYKLHLAQSGVNSSSLRYFEGNKINRNVILDIDAFSLKDVYRWSQWRNSVISSEGFEEYMFEVLNKTPGFEDMSYDDFYNNDTIVSKYLNQYRLEIENAYKFDKRLLGNFYGLYKSQYDSDYANEVYIELKNLETSRLAYLYRQNPNFKTYFTWKINVFLKVFSAYGTEPSEAIIISIYVILFFAGIYIFFPNSWDSMNKNRLMRRIQFYTRYFRKKEGMKEIYQEDRKESLMTFNEFKNYMNESKKEVPSYFLWLAKPIYYFSSSNYKLVSRVLDKTDVLKGRWIDLPPRRKIFTSVFIGFWMVGLLLFDVALKFLNALTLSLNTFTTLGFGEIPTIGLPRYLAIVQGFIGWFMLSIFSVSLISQLLN